MITFPHAKINIGLNIISKRTDGFHNIESCFYPIGWKDALEILPSEKETFSSSGLPIPGDLTANLCLQAYRLLKKDFNLAPVQIHLHKVIPMGAGLGGGSSDAAFTIKILNEIFQLSLKSTKMLDLASKLGSDCAFFIQEKPVIAKEKGNIFEGISLSLENLYLVAVNPGIHVNTAQAYASITPQLPKVSLYEALKTPVASWKNKVVNDFEKPVFKAFPEIETIKTSLYDQGAIYASMSGSGSSVYGIFLEKPELKPIFPLHYSIWEQKI